MKRAHPLLAAALGVMAVALPAGASAAPTYSSLPEVSLPEMLAPVNAPASVPASEKVASVSFEVTGSSDFSSKSLLKMDDGQCVLLDRVHSGPLRSGSRWAHSRTRGTVPVPFRIERVITPASGAASLEVVDGWFDVNTHGMRAVTTTRVPLAILAKGPSTFAVYGFRTSDRVHIVMPAADGVSFLDDEGVVAGRANCGHARFTLDSTQRGGDMVLASAFIAAGQDSPGRDAKPLFSLHVSVNVSVSRTARDKEPRLSSMVSWAEELDVAAMQPTSMPSPQSGQRPALDLDTRF